MNFSLLQLQISGLLVQSVKFGCSCSADKVRSSLSIYSAKDLTHMTTEDGEIVADCQFCGAQYVMDPKTVGMDAKDAG